MSAYNQFVLRSKSLSGKTVQDILSYSGVLDLKPNPNELDIDITLISFIPSHFYWFTNYLKSSLISYASISILNKTTIKSVITDLNHTLQSEDTFKRVFNVGDFADYFEAVKLVEDVIKVLSWYLVTHEEKGTSFMLLYKDNYHYYQNKY